MKTLIAYLQLLPTILGAVQSLESAIPVPATGKQKLDLLLSIVKTAYDTEETVRRDVPWEKLSALISTATASIVSAFNALGIFHHQQSS
jgi:hypothetical protein